MKSLVKNLMCIVIRGGIEIWIENDKAEKLKNILLNTKDKKFVEIDGEVFSTFEVVGILTPQTMADKTRRQNGEWKCKENTWHKKKEECACTPKTRCAVCGKETNSFIRGTAGIICDKCNGQSQHTAE